MIGFKKRDGSFNDDYSNDISNTLDLCIAVVRGPEFDTYHVFCDSWSFICHYLILLNKLLDKKESLKFYFSVL